MNKVLNTIFESGMRILLVLGIILAVQGCSKDSYRVRGKTLCLG